MNVELSGVILEFPSGDDEEFDKQNAKITTKWARDKRAYIIIIEVDPE